MSPRGGWHQAWHGAGPGVINSYRVAGGGLRFSLSGSPVGGAGVSPLSPQPLCQCRPRLPSTRKPQAQCCHSALSQGLLHTALSPGKGLIGLVICAPADLGTHGQAAGTSEPGRGHTHAGLTWPPPSSMGALGVLGRTMAPGSLPGLRDTQAPPALSPAHGPGALHRATVHLGWPPRVLLESGCAWEGRSWEAHFRAMSLLDAPLMAGRPGSLPYMSNNSRVLDTFCTGPSHPVHASWASQPCQPWWQRGLFSKPKDRPSGSYLALGRRNVISRIFWWIIRTAGLARKL